MSKEPHPSLEIDYPGLLFTHVWRRMRKWFLTVQRSPGLDETDPRYEPVREFLKTHDGTLEDQYMFPDRHIVGGKNDFRIYRLNHP